MNVRKLSKHIVKVERTVKVGIKKAAVSRVQSYFHKSTAFLFIYHLNHTNGKLMTVLPTDRHVEKKSMNMKID